MSRRNAVGPPYQMRPVCLAVALYLHGLRLAAEVRRERGLLAMLQSRGTDARG